MSSTAPKTPSLAESCSFLLILHSLYFVNRGRGKIAPPPLEHQGKSFINKSIAHEAGSFATYKNVLIVSNDILEPAQASITPFGEYKTR